MARRRWVPLRGLQAPRNRFAGRLELPVLVLPAPKNGSAGKDRRHRRARAGAGTRVRVLVLMAPQAQSAPLWTLSYEFRVLQAGTRARCELRPVRARVGKAVC